VRILITGSRDWTNSALIWDTLDLYLQDGETLTVVHGNAPGADSIAWLWAIERANTAHDVEVENHPAQWTKFGRSAGPIRNQEMVDLGADLVLAFIKDNSPGASHLVRQARKAGLAVDEFHETTEVDMTEVAGETVTVETPPTLVERLVAVKRDIGAVGKDDRNSQQGFNFRGIDAVLNAVSAPLIKHGVMVYPRLQSLDKGTATTGNGKVMNTVVVTVEYVFTDGRDRIVTVTPGEAFDSGDKCVAKAMSVAYRTALIQALSLPTDEPDPDSESYDAQPKVAQLSDDELLAAINAETSVTRLQEIWPEQGLSRRPAHLQAAVQTRAATLRAEQAEQGA
jgi:hypothetical protein